MFVVIHQNFFWMNQKTVIRQMIEYQKSGRLSHQSYLALQK
jgi:hypothetical protein